MAIYHCSIKPVSRAQGRTATASAAYRTASFIRDERTGQLFDYSRKRGVEHTEILLPLAAVKRDIQWARDRHVLWNAAEAAEVRKDARVAREYELALPHELGRMDRVALTRTFAQEIADRYNVAADFGIHRPDRAGDHRNYHVHLLTTTRQIEPTGLGAKSAMEWSNTDRAKRGLVSSSDEIRDIRLRWGQHVNELLQARGLAARVDHRSLKDQGIEREPTTHLGPAVMGMQRRGVETEVCKRIAWEQQRAAQERLERAAEEGRLERASAGVQKSIIDVTADLAAARKERLELEALPSGLRKWKEEYQNQPRPSAEEVSRKAAENWKAVRDQLSRARAFEHLPEQEALAKHPELKPFYEGWKVFEKEIAARFADDVHGRKALTGAARRNMIERLEQGQLFTPRDASVQAAAERLELERERQKNERSRDQERGLDGPDF
jgi:MobA/MobL family